MEHEYDADWPMDHSNDPLTQSVTEEVEVPLSDPRLFPYLAAAGVHEFRSEIIRYMGRALSGQKYQVPFRQYLQRIRGQHADSAVKRAAEHLYMDMMSSIHKFKPMLVSIARRPDVGLDKMDVAYLLGMFGCDLQRALHPRASG